MRRQHLTRPAIMVACILSLALPADGQSDIPTFPPSGYPRRTMREIPGVQVGPPSGLVRPGVSTLPSGRVPPTVERVPAAQQTGPPAGAAPQYPQYWSPRSGVWDVRERLSRLAPLAPGQNDRSAAPSLPASGITQDYGLGGSPYGLDVLAPYSDAGKLALPPSTTPAEPRQAAQAPAAEEPAKPANELDIPFEQFESYEEFRTWLTQELAQPGGGAVGQALQRLEAPPSARGPQERQGQAPGQARQAPARSGQAPARSRAPEERPIIGYVGVGSNASVPIGNLQGGGDLALQSARLVADLNEYLRQTRATRRTPRARQPESQRDGMPALPPPRSDLGRQLERRGESTNLYQRTPPTQQFTPQTQPRQYWQNLGGYQRSLGPADWLPPDAGF